MGKARITVMGSFNVDLMMRAHHLPARGETVKGTTFKIGPGGKGSNQAVAAQRAGAEVTMITKIGKDHFAPIALDSFRNEGMDTSFVFQDNDCATGAALIMVDENTGENIIVIAPGANERITREDMELARTRIEGSQVLLTQLETNIEAVEWAVDIAHRRGIPAMLNPAPACAIPDHLLKKISILTPNETEASILVGFEVVTVGDASKAARLLVKKGIQNVIVTLGDKGALVVTDNEERLIDGLKVDVVDSTGAGDAFSGGLATALAEGKNIFEAAEFANATAALCVTKIGTAPAMPSRREIEEALKGK